jgi:hypothetical protein
MLNKTLWLPLVLMLAILSSCTKQEEVLIPGNIPPPDSTLSSIVIDTYVNKAYISLLGRKPSDTEKSEGTTLLEGAALSQTSRESFIQSVLDKPEYYENLYKNYYTYLLVNFDTAEITQTIIIYQYLSTQPEYANFIDALNTEIGRLQALKSVYYNLAAGNISVPEMHYTMINNSFYDELNMGTENFITATFEHFLSRYPTDSELAEATKIVDGLSGVLFFEIGTSKQDFMDIFFASEDYYGGQVKIVYNAYLFRQPTTEESAYYSTYYKNSNDYKGLLKKVLTTDEYVGIN